MGVQQNTDIKIPKHESNLSIYEYFSQSCLVNNEVLVNQIWVGLTQCGLAKLIFIFSVA